MLKISPGAKVVVIVGPTASGKTALSLSVARRFNGEVISADSRQIYRGMDIGTAKPPRDRANTSRIKPNEKRIFDKNSVRFAYYSGGVRHHLINIKDPDEKYSVGEYKKNAVKAIAATLERKKLPILVGGTGLYIKAVVDNLEIPEVKPDSKLRADLEGQLKRRGVASLFEKLVTLDPEAIYIVDPKNPRRIIRALEIAITTKKPFSAQRNKGAPLFQAIKIGINPPKDELKEKIYERVDAMMHGGLINEVRALVKTYGPGQIAFDAIGYREIIDYLEKKIPLEEAVELIKKKTWAYARRQMTWFKKDKEIYWVRSEREAIILTREFLKN